MRKKHIGTRRRKLPARRSHFSWRDLIVPVSRIVLDVVDYVLRHL
jgi:hypothetical protein